MAKITYEDKSNSLPITNVRRIYRDIDANEVKDVVNANDDLLPTNQFGRAFTEMLVFDYNDIEYAPHEASGNLTFQLGSGNLENQFCGAIMPIIFDGSQSVSFPVDWRLNGIVSGQIPEAGSYEIYFLFSNGKVRVNFPGVSQETSSLTQLSAPGSFVVSPDGSDPNTQLNMSWADVANESGYQIERSLTGSGSWVLYSNPVVDATSASESGLTPGSTVFYRIKALGDGVAFADSPYSTASGTTSSAGDVTAPTFTFNPVNASSIHPVNKSITITANEPLRKDDGSTLSNNDIGIIVLKQTNSGGTDIACTWTVDVTKTIIVVTPTTTLGTNQLVYLAIDGVEDASGNEIALTSITFTTTAYSYLNGSSNRLIFGDILDGLFAVSDTNFDLGVTLNKAAFSGSRNLHSKYTANGDRTFRFYYNTTSFIFLYVGAAFTRTIVWENTDMDDGENVILLEYRGAIDTNDGVDRCTLKINGVTQTGAFSSNPFGTLTSTLFSSSSQLSFGIDINNAGTPMNALWYEGEAKDWFIKSAMGSVTEVTVPVLRLGTDNSGNSRNGTWV